jgi:hypothetical protein
MNQVDIHSLVLKNASMAGIAFETKLWTRTVLNGDLHAVALLVVSTETNLIGIEGISGPRTSSVMFLRGSALRRMQLALKFPVQKPSEYATSSLPICLSSLAGWEQVCSFVRSSPSQSDCSQVYGDIHSHQIHIQALKNVFGITNGQSRDTEGYRSVEMLRSFAQAVRKRYDELSSHITSDKNLHIDPELDTMNTSRTTRVLPDILNYDGFDLSRRETRTLLFLLQRLATYDLFAANAWPAMHELSLLVFAWRPTERPPSTWLLSTYPKHLEDLALYHIRAGMIAVLGAWTWAVARLKPGDEDYFSSADAMDEHYMQTQPIETEYLVGTEFEEAALWSVFIVTATATPSIRSRRSIEILRRLFGSVRIDIRSFEQLEGLLSKFAYREAVHKKASLALYHAVTTGVPASEDSALKRLTLRLSDFVIR